MNTQTLLEQRVRKLRYDLIVAKRILDEVKSNPGQVVLGKAVIHGQEREINSVDTTHLATEGTVKVYYLDRLGRSVAAWISDKDLLIVPIAA